MSVDQIKDCIEERQALWTKFLARWPLERLGDMTLPEYNQAGGDDHFCRWVEKHTEALGSIWGGNSLKFGIYSKASEPSKKPTAQHGVLEDGRYAWYAKYGANADTAFARVRELVIQVARAARAGRLHEVEQAPLWPLFRRKIAFLYQDRQHPCLLPIYMGPMLRLGWTGDDTPPHDAVDLYRGLMAQRGNRPLLAYYDEVLGRVKAAEAQQIRAQRTEVLDHFAALPDLTQRLEAAGQTEVFCRLALALRECRLDWWIRGDEAIHAGRSDDPKVWQTVVALALKLNQDGVWGRLHSPGDPEGTWQRLNADLAAEWADAAAADPRVPALSGREPCWPDDYDRSDTRLTVLLTGGSVRRGYIKVPKSHPLFPPRHWASDSRAEPEAPFSLQLPDGTQMQSHLLTDRSSIKPMPAVFARLGVKEGDRVTLRKVADGRYQLLLRDAAMGTPAPKASSKQTDQDTAMSRKPLNQILFGPPGTGKTFATIDHALAILDPELIRQHQGQEGPEARAALKRRFDELSQAGRIRFVTFHQSFSYEDFVEGLRAVSDEDTGGQLRYEVVDGVFKDLCLRAQAMAQAQPASSASGTPLDLAGRRIWKMSLGSAVGERAYVFDDCMRDGVALLGYGYSLDYSGCGTRQQVRERMDAAGQKTEDNDYAVTAVHNFVNTMRRGDLIVVTEGNLKFRAIGEVTGDYRHDPRNDEDHYRQARPVRWLRRFEPALGYAELMHNRFSQMTLYELREGSIDMGKLAGLLAPAPQTTTSGEALPHVLIIDEINRGNVSRAFGELITLIEPSKRAGAAEALSVTLPYSHQSFSVPDNVYLIGTMNTADRSLAGLDVALRRRFVFKEMQPQPELLDGVVVHGVDIGQLLRTLNERIEALLDREHCLGHAYFMPLKGLAGAEAEAEDKLAEVFANQVLPLLQEYFFDDWQRIQWVLNDHRKPEPQHRFVQDKPLNVAGLFGVDVPTSPSSKTWRVNAGAFALAASYQGVLSAPAVSGGQDAP